jgi:hypothetical protein
MNLLFLCIIGVNENRMNIECLMNDIDFNVMLKEEDFIANSKDLVPRFEKVVKKMSPCPVYFPPVVCLIC